MSTPVGAIIMVVVWAIISVCELFEKRAKLNHERSITATCKREKPTEDEWARFALATTPERFVDADGR